MVCPTGNIKFGTKSRKGLEHIRDQVRNGQLALTLFGAGTFASLFAPGRPFSTSYQMLNQDWDQFAEASRNFNFIVRHNIRIQAGVLANDYTLTQQEQKFWQGVLTGCQ